VWMCVWVCTSVHAQLGPYPSSCPGWSLHGSIFVCVRVRCALLWVSLPACHATAVLTPLQQQQGRKEGVRVAVDECAILCWIAGKEW